MVRALKSTVVQALLEGHNSDVMQEISAEDNRRRQAVAAERCPACSSPLVARIPRDPTNIYVGTSVNYQKWCSFCQRFI